MKWYFRTSYPCMHCIHCCGGDFKANCSFTQSQPLFSCSTLCDGNSIFASWRVLKQVLPLLVGCCVRYKPLMWAERSADESTSLPNLCEFHHDQPGFLTEIKDTSRQKVLNIQVHSRMILHLYTCVLTAHHSSTHHHRHPKQSQKDVPVFWILTKDNP